MTPETREALKEFATILSDSMHGLVSNAANRLICALEHEKLVVHKTMTTKELRDILNDPICVAKAAELGWDVQSARRLIRALEQEPVDPVQPLRRPTVNLIHAVRVAVMANGGFAHKKELCKCSREPQQEPCRYCAIHEGLTKAFTFLRALEQEPSALDKIHKIEERLLDQLERKQREATVKAIRADYETWRDEQLDTLRKLYRQRGPDEPYKSFPDFCRWAYEEGSDKGKVKI